MTHPTISEITGMGRTELLDAWNRYFKTPVPKSLSRSFLRRFIAFEVQAQELGGLPKGFAKDMKKPKAPGPPKAARQLKPGGRLLREWNGKTHVVEVTKDGYLWNQQTYRSLSSVARAITGARWSGPRFFGLRDQG